MSKSKNNRSNHQASTKPQHSRGLEGDLSISAINFFIERKVEEGVKELKKKFWPNTLILIILGGVGIWGLFKGITDDIQERLTSAYVADTLDEHIRKFTDEKVANVADGRISIAETRIIDDFEKKVAEQQAMLDKSSAAAEMQIQSLRSTLEVMKMAYDARGGDRRAFDEIAILATNRTEAGEIASKVIREIEASYADRKEKERIGFIGTIRHTVTYNGKNGKHGPISFAEATMLVVTHNRDFEEGAINRLVDSGQKEFVGLLMLTATETDRLDLVYVALRGIEKLTGASFPVLGVSEVNKWWESNKDNPEYHSLYKTAWTILLNNQVKPLPNESDLDYYKRVVIPLHDAVVSKSDLQTIAKSTLPIAFGLGLDLNGAIEGVDCLKITKDLIARLGDDAVSRRMAFCYTAKTMALYENAGTDTMLNYAIRSVRAHPDYLEELKKERTFTQEFKEVVESTVKQLEEHTKGIKFFHTLSPMQNGETKFLSNVSDESETLLVLEILVRKDSTFVVRSANDIEVSSGEVRAFKFKTNHKEGWVLLLNDNGVPYLFDVRIDNQQSAADPETTTKAQKK